MQETKSRNYDMDELERYKQFKDNQARDLFYRTEGNSSNSDKASPKYEDTPKAEARRKEHMEYLYNKAHPKNKK